MVYAAHLQNTCHARLAVAHAPKQRGFVAFSIWASGAVSDSARRSPGNGGGQIKVAPRAERSQPLQLVGQTPITGEDDLVLRAAAGVVALRNQAADGRSELRAGGDVSRRTAGNRALWRFCSRGRARQQARAEPHRQRMGAASRWSPRGRAQGACGSPPDGRAVAVASVIARLEGLLSIRLSVSIRQHG